MDATPLEPRKSPTPILDRLASLPEPAPPRSSFGITFGVSLVLGFALGIWHPPFIHSLRQRIAVNAARMFAGPWTIPRIFAFTLSALLIVFVVVALHELGHAIAGRVAGFRIVSVRFGPLQFNSPFQISHYRGPGAWSSGAVNLLPNKKDKLLPRAMAMVVAGPAANVLSGFTLLLLPFPRSSAYWLFILVSIVGGLIELLIPFRTPTGLSDAKRLLMLLFHRERAERWLALMKLGAELKEGVPPESLSPDLLAKAVAIRDNSPDTVGAHAFAYSAAFWQNKDAEAAHCLETCLQYSAHAAPAVRQALMTDASVFQARKRKRVDLAEQWLADLPATPLIPWLRVRAEAGILEAQGNKEGALKKLDEVEKKILASPNQVHREISLRYLRRWQSELLSS